jgi:hypothetical protein
MQAVEAIGPFVNASNDLISKLEILLNDPAPQVRTRAAVALLRAGQHGPAMSLLRSMATLGDLEERALALAALGDWGDAEALALITTELEDENAPAPTRRAAARALKMGGAGVVSVLVAALAEEDRSIREAAAESLSDIGIPAVGPTLTALFQPATEHGAIHALERLPVGGSADVLRRYTGEKVKHAVRFHAAWQSIGPGRPDARLTLLADSLLSAAQWQGLHALRAINLLDDRRALTVVMDNLRSRDSGQRANALETMDALPDALLLKPMLKVWEEGVAELSSAPVAGEMGKVLTGLLAEPDAWLRACVVLVIAGHSDASLRTLLPKVAENDADLLVRREAEQAITGERMNTLTTLSIMERVMFLKRVPLFADLPPSDLKQVAAIANETAFTSGDILAEQGEIGREMYVIVNGEVAVRVNADHKPEVEVARRKAGDFVGEMAIISQEPRMASLVALGDVRTLSIDQKSFEGLLRERPEVCLAVLRVLCGRLKELSK